jgi:AcrB/AcrD/AcrF family protein
MELCPSSQLLRRGRCCTSVSGQMIGNSEVTVGLAMEQVSSPVIAIALILAAVFIPTAFIPGITGRLYQQFAVTIAVSVICGNRLNCVVQIRIGVLAEKYPIPAIHLREANLSICGQFIVHRHDDMERIVHNVHHAKLGLVGYASYHCEIERSRNDLTRKFIGKVAPELDLHIREKREMNRQQRGDQKRISVRRFSDIHNVYRPVEDSTRRKDGPLCVRNNLVRFRDKHLSRVCEFRGLMVMLEDLKTDASLQLHRRRVPAYQWEGGSCFPKNLRS